MPGYKSQQNKKINMPDPVALQCDIDSADKWEDAYRIGKCTYEQADSETDKLVMDAYEKAFELGLNIRTDRECFLTATQQIAKIYFHFRKYDEAINKLMILDSNKDNLPDWVNLYYASAQIHTDNILYWAEVPTFLFNRIDRINKDDPESVKRRKYLFLEFLNRISELSKTEDVSGVDKAAILEKAEELGIADTSECQNFKIALGIAPKDSIPVVEPEIEKTEIIKNNATAVFEEIISNLKKELLEQQVLIGKQDFIIKQHDSKLLELEKQIIDHVTEKRVLEKQAARLSEEIRISKEHERALQSRYKALESQLSGSAAIRKQLEENAALIGELQTDVEDLKTALTVSRSANENLKCEIRQYQEKINARDSELTYCREEIQRLNATVEIQKTQVEIAESAVKTAEAKIKAFEEKQAETDFVIEKGSEQHTITDLEPVLTDIPAVESFLPRKQKILIIGGSETKESHLRGKLKSLGFAFSKDQLEFELEYDNVKEYASRIKPWSGKYAGIIVGPCPHKAKDTDGYSSFIKQIKVEEGYPHVEEARDTTGVLKISNSSIGEAMMRMAVHLQSIA